MQECTDNHPPAGGKEDGESSFYLLAPNLLHKKIICREFCVLTSKLFIL